MQRLRCVILDDYQNVALSMADWSMLNAQVDVFSINEHITDEDALVSAIGDCEIAIIMRERTPFTAALIARLPKLKLLITSGMRNASIDMAAATAQNITVCGTGSRSESPTEITWALMLGLARGVTQENAALRQNGPWQSTLGVGLYGKQLGLLGLGKIGAQMAKIALAFGMKVTAWSQNLTAERAAEVGVTLAGSRDELVKNSDFLSIHLVLSGRSKGIIGAEQLKLMKPSAFLINTSRAGLVDQSALVDALKNGSIAGAGLDVFDQEPLPADSPFRTLPNVLALPHLGYVTDNNYSIYFREAVEDIQAFIQGTPVRQMNV